MYIAELQGKFSPREERMEDILTSNVFSFFKYAKREIFLYELLKLLDIKVNPIALSEAEFIFWPSYEDGTEPDLVIIVGDHYLLFEAKLNSGFGEGKDISAYQLIREYNMGKLEAENIDKKFHLIAITAHFSKHQFLADIAGYFNKKISWINWHKIALLIYNLLERPISIEHEFRIMAEDFYALLAKKGLRFYAGLDVFQNLAVLQKMTSSVFFNAKTAQYRGDFIGFIESFSDISQLQSVNKIFYTSHNKQYFSHLPGNKINNIREHIFFEEKHE